MGKHSGNRRRFTPRPAQPVQRLSAEAAAAAMVSSSLTAAVGAANAAAAARAGGADLEGHEVGAGGDIEEIEEGAKVGLHLGDAGVTIPPLISKLTNESATEREWACSAVANLVEEPQALEVLLKHNVLDLLIARLVDTDRTVQVSAAGAIRNVTAAGGIAVCKALLDKGVLRGADALLAAVLPFVAAEQTDDRPKALDFLEQLVAVLWALCENFEHAVDYVTASATVLDTLFAVISQPRDRIPATLLLVAAETLLTIAEENPALANMLTQRAAQCQALLKLTSAADGGSQNPQLRAIGAGILYNQRVAIQAATGVNPYHAILPVLVSVLREDTSPAIVAVIPMLEQAATGSAAAADALARQTKAQLNPLRSLFDAQQLALEVLSNIAATILEDSVQAGEEWDEMDANDDDDDDDAEMNGGASASAAAATAPWTTELAQTLKGAQLAKLSLQRTQCGPAEIYAPLAGSLAQSETLKSLLASFSLVQARAFSCVQNLVGIYDTPQVFGLTTWGELWTGLFQLAVQIQTVPQVDVVATHEAITSALFALLRQLDELKQVASVLPAVQPVQLTMLAEAVAGSTNDDIRISAVSILGLLEKHTAPSSNDEVSLQISKVLFAALQDSSVLVVAASLDNLFDIFGDVPKNHILVACNGIALLQQCFQRLKQELNGLKSRLGKDAYAHVVEARQNLKRFIDYKAKESRVK